MERGGKFHRYRRHAKNSASSLGTNSQPQNNIFVPNKTISGGSSSSNGGAPVSEASNTQVARQAPCIVREQDQYMPIANVIRIMRRILPPHAKISDDAKETIQECVSEYISFITGEANDRCQKEQRKTITAEDVLWAMGKLGFDDYVEPLSLFLNRYRDSESDRISHRDTHVLKRSSAGVVDCGMMNHAMPQQLQPQYAPSNYAMAAESPSVFDGGMYYRDLDDGGAGTNSNANQHLLHYDPFAQFK
ncbi:Nuclear transcription factor Y subunit B [Euphorbia peplus]|nr:Nuclear transcription factor Y subunit B [Euphorbia peplus]